MSDYVELYKKYRPGTWSEVIGQDFVVQSLKHAVADDRLPTAYLFSGPRGTGKTTAAIILAKAVNCENPDGQGNPCNNCPTCIAIDNGSCPGVHYISAANNGGVDEVRRFMNQARRAATVHKPVWIIDEVHRLSKEGFDSMLIPLEDTNLPSLFIFCTTELNRVPETITSRLQHRAFRLVPSNEIASLCRRLLKQEGYTLVDDDTLEKTTHEDAGKPWSERRKVYSKGMVKRAIRQAGVTVEGGSVRQVLSALEQLLNSPGKKPVNWGNRLSLDVFGKRNTAEALLHLSQAIADGSDARDLTSELLDSVREMVILAHSDEVDPAKAKRREVALKMGDEMLLKAFKRLGEAQRDQLTGDDARVYLELALIDMGDKS